MLWDGDMKMNTVHVFDVGTLWPDRLYNAMPLFAHFPVSRAEIRFTSAARGVVHCARKAPAGSLFNLADKGNTDQGKVCALLASVFGIDHGFFGSVKSNLASLKLGEIGCLSAIGSLRATHTPGRGTRECI